MSGRRGCGDEPTASINPEVALLVNSTSKERVVKKLIAVVLLGLGAAQAGVALADNSDLFLDPYWAPRKFMVSETTRLQGAAQEVPGSDPFQSYAQ
jgi:hypothetical protein